MCALVSDLTSEKLISPTFLGVFPQTIVKASNKNEEHLGEIFPHLKMNASLWPRQSETSFFPSPPIHYNPHFLFPITCLQLFFSSSLLFFFHSFVLASFKESSRLFHTRSDYSLHLHLSLQLLPSVFSHLAQLCVHLSDLITHKVCTQCFRIVHKRHGQALLKAAVSSSSVCLCLCRLCLHC